MSLHLTKAGYTFRADVDSLTIEPGLEPISLDRTELEQIGLAIRDDYRIEVNHALRGNLGGAKAKGEGARPAMSGLPKRSTGSGTGDTSALPRILGRETA